MGQTHNAFRNGTEQETCEAGSAVRRYYNQIGSQLDSSISYHLSRIAEANFGQHTLQCWVLEFFAHGF
jgi:hypothetical protein